VTPVEHTAAIGQILDALGIPWVLGGSMASPIVGEPRSTMDIDVAIQVDVGRVPDLVAEVASDYYVSEAMALDAVERHSSFNLIHFNTGMKIDLFPLSDDLLDVRQLRRRERFEVAPGIELWVGAADDQVLRKLRWFRMGGGFRSAMARRVGDSQGARAADRPATTAGRRTHLGAPRSCGASAW
jgi:hypothetical protein